MTLHILLTLVSLGDGFRLSTGGLRTADREENSTLNGTHGPSPNRIELYSRRENFAEELADACTLQSSTEAPKNVTFHSYWQGPLIPKIVESIKSCYLFNVRDYAAQTRGIILWTDNATRLSADNAAKPLLEEVQKYAQIRKLDLHALSRGSPLESHFRRDSSNHIYYFGPYEEYRAAENETNSGAPSGEQIQPFASRTEKDGIPNVKISDLARYLVLFNYGGLYFDLDTFFLRNFDPLFEKFPRFFMYQWEYRKYPNSALIYSPAPRFPDLVKTFKYVVQKGRGFSTQWNLNFDNTKYHTEDRVPLLVLPCAWFDAGWLNQPAGQNMYEFIQKPWPNGTIDSLASFAPGAFAYHWHNQWKKEPDPRSAYAQLVGLVDEALRTKRGTTDRRLSSCQRVRAETPRKQGS